ncbi:hypothetical protein ARMGADRAFT_1004926 [Armillaria gallica]|uniref:Uncharacterized protein n=1 Tax=Armillaria gallica TaxID=47427 RepID=A0A2H3EEA9_ARMGA|nr:hypothetical protein ARMGADRAFT_1004926 [Armillaria gallica]
MHLDEHYINIEDVIPNSKVVILPGQDGAVWKRQLFLKPGKWIPWVTVTVVVGTILLAVIVLVLHLNEKREDELERRRASHHINFDALWNFGFIWHFNCTVHLRYYLSTFTSPFFGSQRKPQIPQGPRRQGQRDSNILEQSIRHQGVGQTALDLVQG